VPITAANAVLAKSRAMYGKRLTPQNIKDLVNCHNVSEVAAYLKSKTRYAKALLNIEEGTVHRGQLENALRVKLFEDFASLCRYEMSRGDAFSEYAIIKGEIEQILHFLRLMMSGKPEEYIFFLPVFFAGRTSVDLYALSKVRTPKQFFSSMSGSRFGKALAPYAKDDKVEFTAIEQVLYHYLYKYLWRLIEHKATGREKKELKELIGMRIDLLNFAHIYRLKRYFNMSPDEIKPFVFNTSQYLISAKILNSMIDAKTSDDVMEILLGKTFYKKYLDILDYTYVDSFVNRAAYRISKKCIRFSTFPSVVMLSYIFLLETETEDVIKIIEGVRYKLPPEEILSLISSGGMTSVRREGGS
jgi:V/A-type H+-transporting ATPase subunit C